MREDQNRRVVRVLGGVLLAVWTSAVACTAEGGSTDGVLRPLVEAQGVGQRQAATPQPEPTAPLQPSPRQGSDQPATDVRARAVEWCAPQCTLAQFGPLIEASGVENPNATLFQSGGRCVAFRLPAGVQIDAWDGLQASSHVGPVTLSRVCQASLRLFGPASRDPVPASSQPATFAQHSATPPPHQLGPTPAPVPGGMVMSAPPPRRTAPGGAVVPQALPPGEEGITIPLGLVVFVVIIVVVIAVAIVGEPDDDTRRLKKEFKRIEHENHEMAERAVAFHKLFTEYMQKRR
jgi:hypothetical protein